MQNALFVALLNPAITLALALAFLVLWFNQRTLIYLVVLAAGYSLSSVGFVLQYFVLPVGIEATKLLSNIAFVGAGLCICGAVCARYGRSVPYLGMAVLALGGLACFSWFLYAAPDLTWRVYSINFALGGMSMLVAAELRTVRNRGPAEMVLFVLALISGMNFFVRTIAAVSMHGPFASYDAFYSSLYWTTAMLAHALLAVLTALTLLIAALFEQFGVLRSEAATDPLSGLLNRRGFEEQATRMLKRCLAANLPVSLVLTDLDRFKDINDRHGHATGDRVIADFAAKLRFAAGARGVAGRIGGEEFAVLLPLADLAAARLFAEAIRTLCATSEIEGLPKGVHVTASFGVAARTGDEGLEPLTQRADAALYQAKRNGRDSVRLSYQRPETPYVRETAERAAG